MGYTLANWHRWKKDGPHYCLYLAIQFKISVHLRHKFVIVSLMCSVKGPIGVTGAKHDHLWLLIKMKETQGHPDFNIIEAETSWNKLKNLISLNLCSTIEVLFIKFSNHSSHNIPLQNASKKFFFVTIHMIHFNILLGILRFFFWYSAKFFRIHQGVTRDETLCLMMSMTLRPLAFTGRKGLAIKN